MTRMDKLRQFLVDLIVKLWPIMPRRLRAWAFLNDGPLKPGTPWFGRRQR